MKGSQRGLYVLLAWVILLWVLAFLYSGNSSRSVGSLVEGSGAAASLLAVSEQAPAEPQAIIVLSNGNGKLGNCGLWAGFGRGSVVELEGKFAGTIVDKRSCPFQCEFTHDQTKIPQADAVLMEYTSVGKSAHISRADQFPFPDYRPSTPGFPLRIGFSFEPSSVHYMLNTPTFLANFDIVMNPSPDANLPVTMVCPWGHDAAQFLVMPDMSKKKKLVGWYSEDGSMARYGVPGIVHGLIPALGRDGEEFTSVKSRLDTMQKRLDWLSQFYFVLITESHMEADWIEHYWSQVILAGSVPIYVGTADVLESTPGPGSFVNLNDWNGRAPEQLITFLRDAAHDPTTYERFFLWKRNGLSQGFKEKLSQCVFYSECRVCEQVLYWKTHGDSR